MNPSTAGAVPVTMGPIDPCQAPYRQRTLRLQAQFVS